MNTHYKLFAFLLFLGIASSLYAQHERDNWYFAHNCGIKFVNGIAVLDSNKNLDTKASACISDKNTGEFLFYTDGKQIWDKNHNVMPGGDSVIEFKWPLFYRTTIITPFPGSKTKYYVFSSNYYETKQIGYAIVDMSLNNGLGKVISNKNILYKISNDVGFTAIANSCGNAVWLIAAYCKNSVDTFAGFKITSSGIDANPVINPFPSTAPKSSYSMLLRPDRSGSRIASKPLLNGKYPVSIFNFDALTGKLFSNVNLQGSDDETPRGFEFSEDGSKFYIAFQGNYSSRIAQYTGASFSPSGDVAIRPIGLFSAFTDMLRGPDGKLYVRNTSAGGSQISNKLDVISAPNNNYINCGYLPDAIIFPGGRQWSYNNFPNFTQASLPTIPDSKIELSSDEICINDTVKCSITQNTIVDSIFWDFGETLVTNDTSTRLITGYNYPDTGYKIITVRWYSCGQESTITKKLFVHPQPSISLGPDTFFCYKSTITLIPSGNFKGFEWSTGDKPDTLKISKSGIYSVKTSIANCMAYDTVKISGLPPVLVEIGDKYSICPDDNEEVKLDPGKGYSHYLWTPTGDTTQWIIVKESGDYYVEVIDYKGCKGNDYAKVIRLCDLTFFIPNSFSPNGDGKNDFFGPVCPEVSDYYMEIFNRWGEKVFESIDPKQTWDGIYNGKPAPYGHYMWHIRLKGANNKIIRDYNHKGVVTLIR